mmetsp:Transcript_22147/g.68280  ORF Transcript_22147/g.68280 Transcript_22147/m.68280 type:complete len:256 (+) Transcript_22147:609-1376(+)
MAVAARVRDARRLRAAVAFQRRRRAGRERRAGRDARGIRRRVDGVQIGNHGVGRKRRRRAVDAERDVGAPAREERVNPGARAFLFGTLEAHRHRQIVPGLDAALLETFSHRHDEVRGRAERERRVRDQQIAVAQDDAAVGEHRHRVRRRLGRAEAVACGRRAAHDEVRPPGAGGVRALRRAPELRGSVGVRARLKRHPFRGGALERFGAHLRAFRKRVAVALHGFAALPAPPRYDSAVDRRGRQQQRRDHARAAT